MNKENLSENRLLYLKEKKRKKIVILSFQIGILATFLLLWEVLAKFKIIDSFLMSMPSKILYTIKDLFLSGDLFTHIFTTLYETLLGFMIATILGSIIAIFLWCSEYLRKILEPYIVVLNSLPKIALGPIIIVWFGAGTKSIVFMAIIITIIVTIITMENGFLSVDKNKIKLLKTFGANKTQILFKLILPASTKTFVSCLKINVGMSWIGSIMGEYLVSKQGIGYLIVYGGQVFKLDLVMASTVILCLLAGLMYLLVVILEKFINKRH
ncbi:MAG: ABC transporter permease [Clostridia bacterium]|nr:ABC transporter permease [Clostridia bacterium]